MSGVVTRINVNAAQITPASVLITCVIAKNGPSGKMKYKNLYRELAELLTELGCSVADHDFLGYCYQTAAIKGLIVIKANMNYKGKYFVLAHEAGHLFYMRNGKFNWSKKPRTEEQANTFAVKLLKFNEIESHEYYKHYNRAKKNVKKRIKSWFEI